MTELIKIAVDAMGGDNSPNKIIDGVILNHKSNKNVFYKRVRSRSRCRKNGNIYLAKTRLSSEPSDIVDTGVVLKGSSAAQFIIVQMDFNNNKTSIWVDPELNSFDYVSPSTAPDAFLSYSSSFNRISLISQTKWDYGVPTLFDEISVIKKN